MHAACQPMAVLLRHRVNIYPSISCLLLPSASSRLLAKKLPRTRDCEEQCERAVAIPLDDQSYTRRERRRHTSHDGKAKSKLWRLEGQVHRDETKQGRQEQHR